METDESLTFNKTTTMIVSKKIRFQQATTGLKINPPPRDIYLLFWLEMVVEKILEHFKKVCKPKSNDKIGLIIEREEHPNIFIWISLTDNELLTGNKVVKKICSIQQTLINNDINIVFTHVLMSNK